MKLRILSDCHLEFSMGNMVVPELPDDKDTILILAGDIGLAKRPTTYRYFIEDMSPRFRHIFYVLGNHEHYKGRFPTTYNKIWNEMLDFENVSVMEKECEVIDDVAFIGSTLWSSMNGHDILCMEQCRLWMNDYATIRTGPMEEPWKRKLRPVDTVNEFMNSKFYIFEEIKKQHEAGNKTVVITHHAPCLKSIRDEYKADPVTGAYYTELSEDIFELQPNLWIHGHVHNSSDYHLDNTRIICNPRGYDTGKAEDRNIEFNANLVIEI